MSEENQSDNDPERTLVTLEQLSQTIEVMTSVVNRLRQHLSDQLQAKLVEQKNARERALAEQVEPTVLTCMEENAYNPESTNIDDAQATEEALGGLDETASDNAIQAKADAEQAEQLAKETLKSKQEQQCIEDSNRESFVVEIRQQEPEPVRKGDKTLH